MRDVASRLFPRLGRKKPRLALAAFGKHPGWDDHIEDLGLETEFLTEVKRVLYVEGIGRNIDGGAWQALEQTHRLPGFAHLFVWRVGGELAVGRMWDSRDGRGRSAYPMIACAHTHDIALSWALANVPPRLAEVEAACRAAPGAPEVVAALDRSRRDLRGPAEATPGAAPSAGVGDGRRLASLASEAELGPQGLGLLRVLYQIERECAMWMPAPGAVSTTRFKTGKATGHHLRLPGCGEGPARRIERWTGAVDDLLVPSTPLLMIAPLDRPWVDAVVGYPEPGILFCILAGERQVPLTTAIPYALDPDFESRARERLSLPRGPASVPP